jgi:Xaa-Pro aminopeptidase
MSEYKAALERFRGRIPAEVDALLVTEITNVGWLTGFTGTSGKVILGRDDAVFLTDSRYTLQAHEQVSNMDVATYATPVRDEEFLATHLARLGVKRLGFDSTMVTVAQLDNWREKVPGVEWVPAKEAYANLRSVKFEYEIDRVRTACELADATFSHVQRMLQPGVTEAAIALDIEFFMRRHGAKVAFESIVVSGERSARPHGVPSDKPLEVGDFVTMDFGAMLDGYNSDITRTVVIGEATDRHREIYNQVLRANVECIEFIKPGMKGHDVDTRAREILNELDLGQYFGHGLGHGLGRLVHDSGRLGQNCQDVIEVGQIWTIEPGVYIPGFGGVRVEDDIVIRENGAEVLTSSPKELLVLGS